MTGHLLIGPPASGKSTFAQVLRALLGDAVIVSTDSIRASLFGSEETQGSWPDIEAEVLRLAVDSYSKGSSVIYDATNANPLHRGAILGKFRQAMPDLPWVGWHLTTPLADCHRWNESRSRVVPAGVIDAMAASLEAPPCPSEGLLAVYSLDPRRPDLTPWLSRSIQQMTVTK